MSSSVTRLFEYSAAAAVELPVQPAVAFPPSLHLAPAASTITPLDLSAPLALGFSPATSPNLLASFITLLPASPPLRTDPTATSQLFYVIRGSGSSTGASLTPDGAPLHWAEGDLFTVPGTSGPLLHAAETPASLYWVHDEPLLRYLGVAPSAPTFAPALYTRAALLARVEEIRHEPGAEHRNRMGVLLAHEATEGDTKTLTRVLWALLNTLPARSAQPPHRHNSVALDLAVSAAPGRVYTLMGPELGADGWVKDPIRMDWVAGAVFTTPPGWWCVWALGHLLRALSRGLTHHHLPAPPHNTRARRHSHHNDSDEVAWVLPVQDAGLFTRQRVLDIRFSSALA